LAYVQVKVSDLTGEQRDEEAFGRLVVRRHPALDAPVQLDILPEEVKDLQPLDDLVQLDYFEPGSDKPTTIVVARKDFDALNPKMDEVLAGARGVRGRRTST
jgi:hypothetical protein